VCAGLYSDCNPFSEGRGSGESVRVAHKTAGSRWVDYRWLEFTVLSYITFSSAVTFFLAKNVCLLLWHAKILYWSCNVVDAIYCGKAPRMTGKTLSGCVSMGVSALLRYQHGSGKVSAHSQFASIVQLIWSDRGGTEGFSTQPVCRHCPTDLVRQRWYSLPCNKKLEICYLFVQFIADIIQC
jgi:hypothetical protein